MAKNIISLIPNMAFCGEDNCTAYRAFISGNTFPIKDAIKSVCRAKWDNGFKRWDCLIDSVETMDALIDVCEGFEVSGREQAVEYMRRFAK